jgi:hypothetical protein
MLAARESRMGCFCHATMAPLRLMLPGLNVSATAAIPGANVAMGLSAWLSARGLPPAAPFAPQPGWLGLPLPRLQMNTQAVATISALASLRAQALAQFGIDLLTPQGATAFARIVATMNARLSALANAQPGFNPLGWTQLAALNNAITQVNLALQAGLLAPPPSLLMALTVPGGIPMARWGGFLAALRALAPMIAAATHLNASLTETAQLSASLRTLARLALPPLVAPQLMASLTAALSAVAQLQTSLGLSASPLQLGLPAVALRVQARLAALMAALRAQFGLSLPPGGDLLAALLALLPPLPAAPGGFATAAVVQAAMQMQAMAALNWQVPATLPAVQIGLPACAFAAQLNASLNMQAVLPAPCGSGCDAARIMRALS